MTKRLYRVGIDCRLAGRRHAGIGRYTENLVRELLQLPTHFEWFLFFHSQEQAKEVLNGINLENQSIHIVPCHVGHYSLMEQLWLPGIFKRQQLDLLHVPHFNVPVLYDGKLIVTIHDLLWHEYRGASVTTLPAWQYWPKYLMYRLTVRAAVHNASQILVPAQTVAKQVEKYYPEVKEKIAVTPEGVEARFFSSQPTPKKPESVLIYLGSLYPHKNVKVVIDALPELPGFTLKIISARNAFEKKLQRYVEHQNLQDRVEFLGYQEDQKVSELLQTATALVQPSLSEGFGLTGLEAMASGTPVIASNIPIFHEVYKDHATFFDSLDPKSMATAVREVQKLDRTAYADFSRKFAKQYQWSKMAKQTADAYTNALKED